MTQEKSQGTIEAAMNHPPLNVLGESVRVLARADETGGHEIFHQTGPAGVGPPPHHHPWAESYYVLSGELEVMVGDRREVLGPGMFVHVPAGIVHGYRNRTTEASFVSVTSSAGAGRFFEEMHREVTEMPPRVDQIVAVATRNRLSLAGPGPQA